MSGVSRDGKRIAAIFDLDGTLLPGPSLERRLFRELRRSRRMTLANCLRWSVEACRLLPHGLLAVQHANKRYLSNVCASRALRHLDSFTFFDEGIARVLWHARQKHEIILLSGTLEALARHAATALEWEAKTRGITIEARVCATKLAEQGGLWTGYVVGEAKEGKGMWWDCLCPLIAPNFPEPKKNVLTVPSDSGLVGACRSHPRGQKVMNNCARMMAKS